MGAYRHCSALEKTENIKEGREKVWGKVKSFKFFIHNMWEGFLIYESDNLCSCAVSRHATLATSFSITKFLFPSTQDEATAPAAWLIGSYLIR